MYLREYNRLTNEMTDNPNNAQPQSIVDFLRDNRCPVDVTLEILSETDRLMDYANECLAKICVEYKIKRVGLFMRDVSGRIEGGLYGVEVGKDANGSDILQQKTRRG